MKRKAEYDLDRKTLENGSENSSPKQQPIESGTIQTSDEISQRQQKSMINISRILKIKQPKLAESVDKPKSSIFSTLFNVSVVETSSFEAPKEISAQLFTNNGTSKIQDKKEELVSQKDDHKYDEKTNLSSLGLTGIKSSSEDLFSITAHKSSLFDLKPTNGGLFGSLPTGGLFSTNTHTASLFDSNAVKGGLFSAQPTAEGLFQQSTSLFGQSDQKLSLFSGMGGMTFNSIANQPKSFLNNDDGADDDQQEGDDEPLRASDDEHDPTQSKGEYQYDEANEKIISTNVHKFKVNDTTYEAGALSIEKPKQGLVHMIIFRNLTKLVLFRGLLLPKLSKFGPLNKKDDCLQVITFSEKQGQAEEGKQQKLTDIYQQQTCKIMFSNKEECLNFKNALVTISEQ